MRATRACKRPFVTSSGRVRPGAGAGLSPAGLVMALSVALLAGPAGAQAQGDDAPISLEVQPNTTHVRVGDVFQVDVTVSLSGSSVEPEELVLPDFSDFELVRRERGPSSQRALIVNGRVKASRSFGFVFHLRATTPGEKRIGPGRARLSGHVATSEPISIRVDARDALGSGGLSSTLDPVARFSGREMPSLFIDARFDHDEVFVGQQALFTVDIYTTEYLDLDLRGIEPPKPPGFFTEVIDAPSRVRPTQRSLGGRNYLVYQVARIAMFPLEAGEHVIEPVSVTVLSSRSSWRRRNETSLSSDPAILVVKELPDEGRPAGFSTGNVGHWQLRAEVSEGEVPLGQPFTLKVTAGGEGNLQALALPGIEEQIQGARVFPPTTSEVKGVQKGRLHGEKSVELLVQPTKAGVFTVPSFTLPFFDPAAGRYDVAKSQELRVRVTPAAMDDALGGGQGARRITHSARPVMRNLVAPSSSDPLYERPLYLASLGGGVLLGLVGFTLGLARARRRATRGAEEERRRRRRRVELEKARGDKDLAAAERVLYDALAERFGDEVRGLPVEKLEAHLAGALAEATRRELLPWLEAAQAARYAPRGGTDKRVLFDDAERLLTALEERA